MSTILDPDYNWKQAASQEGVDYDAVRKSFMDQAYGFVANKAKVLFQDPFRLGFEIVHRNEKATKMVGIFAFRCNNALLYAPVFFVNGEIKAADMLYRGDVKRFVPLTDEWCAFLVRGANQEAGVMEDKSRQRQADAYFDRLAYPQRVKYASEEENAVLRELLIHSAGDEPMRKLIPDAICQVGPDSLEKLAELIEGSDYAKRFLVENYTEAELTNVDEWQKQAAAAIIPVTEEGNIVVVNAPGLCKTAAERDEVMTRGYAITDNRPNESKSAIVTEIESGEIQALQPGNGCCLLMLQDGSMVPAAAFSRDYNLLDTTATPRPASPGETPGVIGVYMPDTKEFKLIHGSVFGEYPAEAPCELDLLTADKLAAGKVYLRLSADLRSCSEPFLVKGSTKDGECDLIKYQSPYSAMNTMMYAPDRKTRGMEFVSDDTKFIEVKAELEHDGERLTSIDMTWTKVPMDSAGIDRWMRTAGGLTDSADVTVKKNPHGLFNITASYADGTLKTASDLGMLAAHLKLANDFELTTDIAGNLLDKTIDDTVTRCRVFSSNGKNAFMTRMNAPAPWIEGYDPELGVKLDAPQRQIVTTHTPQRAAQVQRYGDHWNRPNATPRGSEEDGLPNDALMTKSPEELAQLATQYQLPHIFDHGMLGQMAKSTFNTIAQMQQYIPDLETGVDRYFRILFLLRYRPADFEEAYGRDELMEMESELSELASVAGANLLRLLKRLDLNKVTNQGS